MLDFDFENFDVETFDTDAGLGEAEKAARAEERAREDEQRKAEGLALAREMRARHREEKEKERLEEQRARQEQIRLEKAAEKAAEAERRRLAEEQATRDRELAAERAMRQEYELAKESAREEAERLRRAREWEAARERRADWQAVETQLQGLGVGFLAPGASVRVEGLGARSGLNGALVVCDEFLPDEGHWMVVCEGGELKAVRPENLVAADMWERTYGGALSRASAPAAASESDSESEPEIAPAAPDSLFVEPAAKQALHLAASLGAVSTSYPHVVRFAVRDEYVLDLWLDRPSVSPHEVAAAWERDWRVTHAGRLKFQAPEGSPTRWLNMRNDELPAAPEVVRLDGNGTILSNLVVAFRQRTEGSAERAAAAREERRPVAHRRAAALAEGRSSLFKRLGAKPGVKKSWRGPEPPE